MTNNSQRTETGATQKSATANNRNESFMTAGTGDDSISTDGGGCGNPYRAAGLEDRYTPPGEDKSGRALCQVREKVGATPRELGYPSRVQLVAWYKEWEAGKGSLAEALRCKALSLPWQIQSFTHREIGYPWMLASPCRLDRRARACGAQDVSGKIVQRREEAAEAAGPGLCLTVQVEAGAGMRKKRRHTYKSQPISSRVR